MLILFDIDGTLLLTKGAGIKAMGDAGRELFGAHFTVDGVEFSGRLDTIIYSDLARANAVHEAELHHERFRAAYGRLLQARLRREPTAALLPGVRDLVHHLADLDSVTLGLLTGNYPETGRLKISMAGLDPDLFPVCAWGCEAARRQDLPPLAIERCAALCGRNVGGPEVVIIGDTPHDIACAREHGCRSIGVATGGFSSDALRGAGADLAVNDLSDARAIVNWVLELPASIPK